MTEAETLYNEGEKLKDEGAYEQAVEKFNASAAADATYSLPHLALSIVFGKMQKHEEAVTHAQKACEIEPDDAFNFTTLSTVLQRAYAGTGNTSFIQAAEDAMAKAQMLQQQQR